MQERPILPDDTSLNLNPNLDLNLNVNAYHADIEKIKPHYDQAITSLKFLSTSPVFPSHDQFKNAVDHFKSYISQVENFQDNNMIVLDLSALKETQDLFSELCNVFDNHAPVFIVEVVNAAIISINDFHVSLPGRIEKKQEVDKLNSLCEESMQLLLSSFSGLTDEKIKENLKQAQIYLKEYIAMVGKIDSNGTEYVKSLQEKISYLDKPEIWTIYKERKIEDTIDYLGRFHADLLLDSIIYQPKRNDPAVPEEQKNENSSLIQDSETTFLKTLSIFNTSEKEVEETTANNEMELDSVCSLSFGTKKEG